MYTYDMYRLVEVSRESLLEHVRQRVKNIIDSPELAGSSADLASPGRVFFVAENSERLAGLMKAIGQFAEHEWEVILVAPEPLRDAVVEVWDYYSQALRQRIKIWLVPIKAICSVPN